MTNTILQILEVVAGSIVNGLWISVLLVALTAGVLRMIAVRRTVNASTRYGVWLVALTAIFVAHVIGAGLVGPDLGRTGTISELRSGDSAGQAIVADATVADATAADAAGADALSVDANASGTLEAGHAAELSGAGQIQEPPPAPVDTGSSFTASGAGASLNTISRTPSNLSLDLTGGFFLLATLVLLIWFSRMVAGLASVVSSWRYVRNLKSGAEPIDPAEWSDIVPVTLRRTFDVAESADVTSPVAAGLWNPMILVPLGLRDHLTTDEFRQVLMHEVAHLERFDDWTILIQRIGEALLWHHPAMWKVSSELQEAREIACDVWVVSRTRRPEAYVQSIGRMIELNLGTRSLQLAPGLAAKRGDLMGRMRRLLNEKLPESPRLSGEQIAVAGGLTGLVLVLVVAFVPLMRLAFSFGDGEAMTHVFGDDPKQSIQLQEAPARDYRAEQLPPLAPLPALPELPPLPDFPSVPGVAEPPPPPAPRAASFALREQPPPPPVAGRADAPPPPVSESADLSVHSWIRILDSAAGISSNGARMGLLRTALDKMPDDDRVVGAWIGAVNLMTSSGARSELLVQLVHTVNLDVDRVDRIRSAAVSIPSRGDRDRVLRALSDTL